MAQFPAEYGSSPVGRLVSGDPFNKQTKDADNRPIPEDKQNYWFAIAVEKNAPGLQEMLATLNRAAVAGYQSNAAVMQRVNMGLNAQDFSWKVVDGDEMVVDQQTGQQRLRWAHGAGCLILKFSTTLPVVAAEYLPNAATPTPCANDKIYRGAYVQVAYSCSANGNTDKTAGVYLNPRTIAFVFHGEPIVSGPSMEQQFQGGFGGYRPQGASDSPMAPAGGGMNGGGNMGGGMNGGGMNGGGMGGDPNMGGGNMGGGNMGGGNMGGDPNGGMTYGNNMQNNNMQNGATTSHGNGGGMPGMDGNGMGQQQQQNNMMGGGQGYGGYMQG